jgi:anti-sigma factor RsiW
MSSEATNSEMVCQQSLIAAYVDGELEDDLRAVFEQHLGGCGLCRAELRAHQLFICELDVAMSQNVDVAVPANFSRLIAARAASDMSGVRSVSEHRKALVVCVVLALAAFALLGTAARESTLVVAQRVALTCFGLLGFLWTAFYDTVASAAVISRVISRKVVVESGSRGLLLVLFAIAVFLLSRLISSYHRTRATD